MTVNELIGMLEAAKKELGGDQIINIDITCEGKGDYMEIESFSYSKFSGLSFKIKPPYWVYQNNKKKGR